MAAAPVKDVMFASGSSHQAENLPDWHTPFQNYHGPRRMQSRTRPEKDLEILKALKSLAKKRFHTYRVSPLHMFSYPCLQDYAQMLDAHLEAVVKSAGDPTTNSGFHTKISVLPGLAIGQRDPEAIYIQIFRTQEQKRPAWEGLLCCVEPEQSHLKTVRMPFVLLPLLLVHGLQKFTTAWITWLERTFDCCISPLVIPSCELAWMAAMWTGTAVSVPRSLDMEWFAPSVPDGLHITISVKWSDALRLWDCVHTSGEDEVMAQEVALFKQGLEEHFFHHFRVILSAMILQSVSSGVASAHNSGHIKLFDVQNIPCTLRLLTEIALQGFSG
uniref:centromere protein L n=1 Tax=Myxine glutinosa TaxID=7769 RepID=UPI00358FECB0